MVAVRLKKDVQYEDIEKLKLPYRGQGSVDTMGVLYDGMSGSYEDGSHLTEIGGLYLMQKHVAVHAWLGKKGLWAKTDQPEPSLFFVTHWH